MDIIELMKARHSVRQYLPTPISEELRNKLKEEVNQINKESGLSFQIFFDEPKCFDSFKAHYGNFKGVTSYLALVRKKSDDLDEKCGYYGERFVLFLQENGLNSCFVALTYGKTKAVIKKDEKLCLVISFGYGATQGVPHKSKPVAKLCEVKEPVPDWFREGMEGALLAPTAVNQQKFLISYDGSKLKAKVNGIGFYAKVDLGIVKYNFEAASGHRFDE